MLHSVPFYCVPKITFCASSGHKNTLFVLCNIQRVITELFYFLIEVPNLNIHRDMTFYNF